MHFYVRNISYYVTHHVNEAEMEKEDLLLGNLAHSRCIEMEKLKEGRQQFILVASLLDRIPNLAGLARTCEVSFINDIFYFVLIILSIIFIFFVIK